MKILDEYIMQLFTTMPVWCSIIILITLLCSSLSFTYDSYGCYIKHKPLKAWLYHLLSTCMIVTFLYYLRTLLV